MKEAQEWTLEEPPQLNSPMEGGAFSTAEKVISVRKENRSFRAIFFRPTRASESKHVERLH